jgi:hypothetical protein
MPTPPNFREFSQSSALAVRKNKVDSNGRLLLKFDMLPKDFLRMFIENIFTALADLRTIFTHYIGRAVQLHTAQSPVFAASFLTQV